MKKRCRRERAFGAKGLFSIIPSKSLLDNVIWAMGFEIDLMTDILSWINDRLDLLLSDGAIEVNVIKGWALVCFIRKNQTIGKYTEISSSELYAINTSIINVAMDQRGNIIDAQMIRSHGGVSLQTNQYFKGMPIIKIIL